MNCPLNLAPIWRVTTTSLWIISTVNFFHHPAFGVFYKIYAADDIAVSQAYLAIRRQSVILRRWFLAEIIPFNIDLTGERNQSAASRRVFRIVDGFQFFNLSFRIIYNHHLDRINDAHHPRCATVQIISYCALQQSNIHHAFLLGDTDHVNKFSHCLGRVSAATHSPQSGHARVIPATHIALFDELFQESFA